MKAFSHVKNGEILFIWCLYLPHCVVMSIYKEYRAAITIWIPIKIIAAFDHEKDITTNSSPIKLIVGGRARFV